MNNSILGPPTATMEAVRERLIARGASPLFVEEMLPALWEVAVEYGIRPEPMVAQSLRETGGRFMGDVIATQHNTAGVKWHDELQQILLAAGIRPDASPRHPLAFTLYFTCNDWRVGARVQAEHLKFAWCGVEPPPGYPMVDPRYLAARSVAATKGFAVTWQDLSGRWAVPGVTYGEDLWALALEIAPELAA